MPRANEPDLAGPLARIAAGDRQAMAALYEATAPTLYGIVETIARDATAAVQLTESVYLRIWDRAPRFDPAGEARAWLAAIARGAAVEWRRRVPGASAVAAAEMVLSDETLLAGEAPIAWGNTAALLHYQLRALPDDAQAAIRAAMLTGASEAEIAQAGLMTPEAAARHMRDGLARLASEFDLTPSSEPPLARELALGAMEGERRAQALRMQLANPAFAAEVEAWQQQLAPMLEALPAIQPPGELWARIDALIELREADAPQRQRRRQMRWPIARTTAIGLAAALAGALVTIAIFTFAFGGLTPRPPGDAPVLVAQAAGPDQRPDIAIRYDPRGNALRVRMRRFDPAAGVADLWLLAPNGTPFFLGRLSSNGVARFALPRQIEAMLHDGATVMVTVAPADQARRSQPVGRVVASARFVLV